MQPKRTTILDVAVYALDFEDERPTSKDEPRGTPINRLTTSISTALPASSPTLDGSRSAIGASAGGSRKTPPGDAGDAGDAVFPMVRVLLARVRARV